MQPFTVYLAGAMGGRLGQEVLDERAAARKACEDAGLEVIDPAEHEDIDPLKMVDLRMSLVTMKNFVAKDEFAIRQSNALLVLTGDRVSDGTSWEMGLAHYELHIPVVLVAPKRAASELVGFSNIKADAIFSTVEDAAEFIACNFAEV